MSDSTRDDPRWPGRAIVFRREFLKYGGASLVLLASPVGWAAAALNVLAVRVWPAEDYTRLTLESRGEFRFSHMIVKDPERLVVDLEGVEFNAVLQNLPNQITDADPYIKLIRAGRNRPGVVRLVVELKAEIAPQLFTLPPVGTYGHRLVVDLYPKEPVDPLLALINKPSPGEAAAGDVATPERASGVLVPDKSVVNVDKGPRNDPPRSAAEPDIARLVTVAIDPGHGGEDPGAVGSGGSFEKNVTLEIAHRLRAQIDAQPNMRAMLTREADYFVPLHHRVEKARRVQADLFVSVHADAFVRPEARGSSVFVLSESGASSAAARLLAQKENEADLVGGVNLGVKDSLLARTLLDLFQTATSNDSLKLGKAVLSELGSINTLHNGGVEQAGFAVLKAPDIPSILVETAFISNPDEERRLNDDAYQDKMARAIARGVKRYFTDNPVRSRSKIARLES